MLPSCWCFSKLPGWRQARRQWRRGFNNLMLRRYPCLQCRRSGVFPANWSSDMGSRIWDICIGGGWKRAVTCYKVTHLWSLFLVCNYFFAFNLCTGFDGPWCHRKKWYPSAEQAPASARLSWGNRCKWFLMMLGSYLKGNAVLVPHKMTRPASSAIAKWVVCYKLHWSSSKIEAIDKEIFDQLGHQAITQSDFGRLCAAKTG